MAFFEISFNPNRQSKSLSYASDFGWLNHHYTEISNLRGKLIIKHEFGTIFPQTFSDSNFWWKEHERTSPATQIHPFPAEKDHGLRENPSIWRRRAPTETAWLLEPDPCPLERCSWELVDPMISGGSKCSNHPFMIPAWWCRISQAQYENKVRHGEIFHVFLYVFMIFEGVFDRGFSTEKWTEPSTGHAHLRLSTSTDGYTKQPYWDLVRTWDAHPFWAGFILGMV